MFVCVFFKLKYNCIIMIKLKKVLKDICFIVIYNIFYLIFKLFFYVMDGY